MLARAILTACSLLAPTFALAGPEHNADVVIEKFVYKFSEGKGVEDIVGLFSTDAQFWGTNSSDVGLTSQRMREYFAANFASRVTSPSRAKIVESWYHAPTERLVLVSGRWQVTSAETTVHLRFSAVVENRHGHWLITQFHSSRRPESK